MNRTTEYPVHPLIVNRWSPRAFDGSSMSNEQLFTLFDAARWAPSSYNNQPWRFIYAHRDTPEWQVLFDLLVEFNQSWCHAASALVVICSARNFAHNNNPSRTHSFDTGAAWQNLCTQATSMNLIVHGLEGFDYERARVVLSIPDSIVIEAMCAIGRQAPASILSPELQEREVPSDRNPIHTYVYKGVWSSAKE